jgi:hypothetical protein
LIGSGHFQAKGAVIVHLDDKNIPPARTTSFCFISERYFEDRYKSGLKTGCKLNATLIRMAVRLGFG